MLLVFCCCCCSPPRLLPFAIAQFGALITLLFVVAVLVLAYKRLPLLVFSIVFTVLLAVYSVAG